MKVMEKRGSQLATEKHQNMVPKHLLLAPNTFKAHAEAKKCKWLVDIAAYRSLGMTYGTVGMVTTWTATLMLPEGIQVKVSSV